MNKSSCWLRGAAAVLGAAALPLATAQVVADDACSKYSIDIAAFASCDGTRVARATEAAGGSSETGAIPPAKRSHSALQMTAREAYALIHDPAVRAVLVDVRSSIEIALTGQPTPVQFHVPYQEPVLPLRWNRDGQTWMMAGNPHFADQLMRQLAAGGIGPEGVVILICSSGERSAQAADELADFGYQRLITVVDGFEGDIGADGRRTNGWKNAGLPWTARASAALTAIRH